MSPGRPLPAVPGRAAVAALYGTGDAYMTLAFAAELGRSLPVTVLVKPEHRAIGEMFPGVAKVEADVRWAESDQALKASHENRLAVGSVFFAHPSFVRSGARIDPLAYPDMTSHADLWRAMLGLRHDAPMARGVPPRVPQVHGRVLLIPRARSWPHGSPRFWAALAERLRGAGWTVTVAGESGPLGDLLVEAAASEWVIGPQCGLMMILCHAGFPCRKTFATPAIDDGAAPDFPLRSTFPYGYAEKFAGERYDVEELKFSGDGADVVEAIAGGAHARRVGGLHRGPLGGVRITVRGGDLLDRLAVLSVKAARLGPRAVGTAQELRYLGHAAEPLMRSFPALRASLDALVDANGRGYDHNESIVAAALRGEAARPEDHAGAARANRDRVMARREANRICGTPEAEIKSYYDADLVLANVDAWLTRPELRPRWGWHGDHRAADGTPAYLPAIQQERHEFAALLAAAEDAGVLGGRCLQIGLGDGGASHRAWRQGFGYVCTVEVDPAKVADMRRHTAPEPGCEDVVLGDSSACAGRVGDGFDLLFIDGGHRYADVAADLALYAPRVRRGGIVALHDALRRPRYPDLEVHRLVDELRARMGSAVRVVGDEVGTAFFVRDNQWATW